MKKLNSVWFMAFSVIAGLLALLMMFFPLFEDGAHVYNATNGFFDNGNGFVKGAWPTFLGFMLILLTTVSTFVISLPVMKISITTEKIVLIGGAILNLVGLVLIMLITVFWCSFNNLPLSVGTLSFGSYLASFFALLAGAFNVIAYSYDK